MSELRRASGRPRPPDDLAAFRWNWALVREMRDAARRLRSTQKLAGALVVVVLLLLVACVYSRVQATYDLVFSDPGRVHLLENDPYYHLRHTLFTIEHFPSVQRWDVGTDYPLGDRSAHAGLFHVVLAAVALLAGGGDPSLATTTLVLAWSPVVLAAVTTVLVFVLARRLAGAVAGAAATAAFVLFPGLSFPRTVFGFGDHHAVEIALLTAHVLSCAIQLQRVRRTSMGPPGWRCLAGALPILVLWYAWRGAPFVYLLTVVALLSSVGVAMWRGLAFHPEAALLRDLGTSSTLVIAGSALLFPDCVLEPRFLWQTLALTGSMGFAGQTALRWGERARALTRSRWRKVAVTAMALSLLVAVLFAGDQRYAGLLRKVPSVSEHSAPSLPVLLELHGVSIVLLPAALLTAFFGGIFPSRRRAWPFVTTFALSMLALWWYARDYGYSLAPLLSVCVALCLSDWARRWWRRPVAKLLRSPRSPLPACLPLLIVTLLGLQIWPLGIAVNSFTQRPALLRLSSSAWFDAMDWMRASTPSPRPPVDAAVPEWEGERAPWFGRESYGVLVPWDHANLVAALGRRTPTRSQGISIDMSRWLVSTDEVESLDLLCPRCGPEQRVRYVVLPTRTVAEHFLTNARLAKKDLGSYRGTLGTVATEGGTLALETYGQPYEQCIGTKLQLHDGTELSHYRLVYESPMQSLLSYRLTLGDSPSMLLTSIDLDDANTLELARRFETAAGAPVRDGNQLLYGGRVSSSVKIFEVVRGALLLGKTAPNTTVTVRLRLVATNTGRTKHYRRTTTANAVGDFELRVPHASESPSGVLRPDSPLFVTLSGPKGHEPKNLRIRLSEEDVQGGHRVSLGTIAVPW